MATSLNPSLSTVLAVSVPVMLVSIGCIVVRGFPLFGKMQTKIDALNARVQENLTNVRVVKSFVREDFEEEKFNQANSDLKNTAGRAMKNMILMSPVMTFKITFVKGKVCIFTIHLQNQEKKKSDSSFLA